MPGVVQDVYTLAEIAQAAGLPLARAEALVSSGRLRPVASTTTYFPPAEALAAVLLLRADGGRSSALLFERQGEFAHPASRLPIAVSSALHACVAAVLVLLSSIGAPQAADDARLQEEPVRTRLVFIASPGPGGGGGGGGLRHHTPASRAQRKGTSSLDSPVLVQTPPKLEPAPEPEPPQVTPEPPATVVAPVATVAANEQDRPGVVDNPAETAGESQGPGAGGGAGSGSGHGIGPGTGSGIGPGSGGGTGGGPYRPGSGITPPRLLREIKPSYAEEARLRRVEGEVVLDIVVRRDGSVGDVTLVRGLPSGLNEQAISAVRQWRFAPGTRMGQPVDVAVNVFVEFRLR